MQPREHTPDLDRQQPDDGRLERRRFLTITAFGISGMAAAPLASRLMAALEASIPDRFNLSAALPPRTVGARTSGGQFAFDPPGLHLPEGGEVIWLNMGDFHTTSAFHPGNAGLLSSEVPRRVPPKTEAWHSGYLGLDAGSTFRHRFKTKGVHDYFCQPHYSFGMVGRVVVGTFSGDPPGGYPETGLVKAAQKQMPSVGAILAPSGRTFEWAARLNGLLLLIVEEGDPVPALDALRDGISTDEALAGVLNQAGHVKTFEQRLSDLGTAVREQRAYEELVTLADEAKAPLEEARKAAGLD